jgi:hypothetical protein
MTATMSAFQIGQHAGGAGRVPDGAAPPAAQARGPQRARLRVGVEAPQS